MILKISNSHNEDDPTEEKEYPDRVMLGNRFIITWDMTRDFAKESIPDEVANCLRMAQLATSSKLSILPEFKEIYRQGCLISI